MENVDIELRDLDEEELQQINKFMLSGCSCVLEQSLEMSSISPSSLEAYVLGHFSAINRTDKRSNSKLVGKDKSSIQRLYAHYSSNGFIHKDNNSKGKPSKNPWNHHGICIPGRVPSHHDFKSIRFPSHWNREVIYQNMWHALNLVSKKNAVMFAQIGLNVMTRYRRIPLKIATSDKSPIKEHIQT
ncbi:Putative LOC582807 [Caligus rogercresseyi]|uniref:LOC582807 n=1 Tax=Caligus rogercresseyi TaxID=217165 RepID=A0A7T8HJ24_CALRO|nr:Putative LOC582807 [Caligus rogercresseyi]